MPEGVSLYGIAVLKRNCVHICDAFDTFTDLFRTKTLCHSGPFLALLADTSIIPEFCRQLDTITRHLFDRAFEFRIVDNNIAQKTDDYARTSNLFNDSIDRLPICTPYQYSASFSSLLYTSAKLSKAKANIDKNTFFAGYMMYQHTTTAVHVVTTQYIEPLCEFLGPVLEIYATATGAKRFSASPLATD
jgi:hypothetical protein